MDSDNRIDAFFQRRPDEGIKPKQWRLRRCRAGERLVGMCLSGDVIGGYTHWFRGRTIPCLGDELCEACPQAIAKRWHAWFGALINKQTERVIIEITLGAMQPFDEWRRKHTTLRGAIFELSRKDSRANGELFVKLRHSNSELVDVPHCEHLREMLFRMWEVPAEQQILLPLDAQQRTAKRRKQA